MIKNPEKYDFLDLILHILYFLDRMYFILIFEDLNMSKKHEKLDLNDF